VLRLSRLMVRALQKLAKEDSAFNLDKRCCVQKESSHRRKVESVLS